MRGIGRTITGGRCLSGGLAVALCVGSAAPALAGDMPRFDVEKHCAKVASFGGTYSASMDKSCFDGEQAAYDKLKPIWGELPDATTAHCLRVARFGGPGSYTMLESCVRMELEAAGSVGGRQFKF